MIRGIQNSNSRWYELKDFFSKLIVGNEINSFKAEMVSEMKLYQVEMKPYQTLGILDSWLVGGAE